MSYLDLSLGNAIARLRPVSLHLKTRLAVWKSRRALAALDARALEDIGVSAEEAQREARLTVWDVPPNWKGL